MTDKICCLFEGENAAKSVKDWEREIVKIIDDSYRDMRILYRCRKCGELVLFDYDETAYFVPGEDWDNAYCTEYYWPVLAEDIQNADGDIEFDWSAITARKHISADYRELDTGQKPYRYVEAKQAAPDSERKDFSKESPVTVTVDSLPMGKQSFDDMCIFIAIPEFPNPRDLKILLPNHDGPQEIRVSYKGETYSMELSFPMVDFGWAHPLVLRAESMAFEDVKNILTEICLNQTETESIPQIVESFKDVTAEVFGYD